MQKPSLQSSQLLSALFEPFDAAQRITVFHAGSALQDTVNFFSSFRCKLHFIDLFAAMPLGTADDENSNVDTQLSEALQFSPDTRFDVCLFWDLFNYLSAEHISSLLCGLRPYLKAGSLAHAFSVHNTNSPCVDHLYGIQDSKTLSFRKRASIPAAYAPHSQGQLKSLLQGFKFERSVLLPDSRLELLLRFQGAELTNAA